MNRSVCALLCSHNRKAQTLACLRALQASSGLDQVTLSAVLVDDGSSDGTADAVAREFPWVQVLHGDGTLYWCRAMHRAFTVALRDTHDHYLWLNDDTLLHADALVQLLACAAERAAVLRDPVIVVGSTVDQRSGKPSYGGRVGTSRWRPTHWRLLTPSDVAQRVDTFDGNLVLVSDEAARRTGNLDESFEHAMGDTDYALRARRAGVALWLAPGVLASCAVNATAGGFGDSQLPLAQRWRAMMGRKGLPWRSWWRFTRRHGGVAWPLVFAWPYVRVLLGRSARPTQD